MNSSKRMSKVWHISLTKNILRISWAPLYHKPRALAGKKDHFHDSGENSKETLIAGELSDGRWNAVEVPRGFLAVYVGPELRRFVIPASYLSMPDFRALMERVAEEFGFEQEGGLRIPCEEQDFEEILLRCLTMHQMMAKNKKKKKNKIELHHQ